MSTGYYLCGFDLFLVYGMVAAAWLEYPLSTLLVLTAVTT
jgi:hypothetical protein